MDAARSNSPIAGSLNVPSSGAGFRKSSLSESNQRVSRLKAEISARERDDLEIIKKDVCDWLAKTLEIEVSSESFMDTLDTGVVLCKLAKLIQDRARSAREAGEKVGLNIPMDVVRCQINAKKGSFFARDNTANFIKWCKKLGVNEEVMFESNGLVQQEDEKRVILCLIDVSRHAQKVHIKPPELVRLENEIDMLERESEDSVFNEQPTTPPLCKCAAHTKDSSTSSSISSPRSSISESVVDDREDPVEVQQDQELPKQPCAQAKLDHKVEEKVIVKPDPVIGQSLKSVVDGQRPRAESPKSKEKTTKKLAQRSPRKSPHRSPNPSPRHNKQQQSPRTKSQQAKKEEAASEEKTDELVRSCMTQFQCY